MWDVFIIILLHPFILLWLKSTKMIYSFNRHLRLTAGIYERGKNTFIVLCFLSVTVSACNSSDHLIISPLLSLYWYSHHLAKRISEWRNRFIRLSELISVLPLLYQILNVCVFRGRQATVINGQSWAHHVRPEKAIMRIIDFPYSYRSLN